MALASGAKVLTGMSPNLLDFFCRRKFEIDMAESPVLGMLEVILAGGSFQPEEEPKTVGLWSVICGLGGLGWLYGLALKFG